MSYDNQLALIFDILKRGLDCAFIAYFLILQKLLVLLYQELLIFRVCDPYKLARSLKLQ